jgi:rubrerythrin
MEQRDTGKNVIMKMEILERVIGQLYRTYAKKFPSEYSFWMQLSNEEEEHAGLIKDLGIEVKRSNLSFNNKRFNINAIQTTILYIQKKISQARDSSMTEQNAYNIAWDIENGLLEKNFFKTFKTDQPGLKNVLTKLIHDTEEHRNRIIQKKNNHTFRS